MKKFLMISGGLLIFALLATVVVFWYVSVQLKQGQAPVTKSNDAVTPDSAVGSQKETLPPQEGAIPLREVPLSDSQRNALDNVGVDVETFVITPAMQDCAGEKLGATRMAEIVAGDAPTAFETAKLVPCLGAE